MVDQSHLAQREKPVQQWYCAVGMVLFDAEPCARFTSSLMVNAYGLHDGGVVSARELALSRVADASENIKLGTLEESAL